MTTVIKNTTKNYLHGRLVPYWDCQKTMVNNSNPQGIPQKSGWQVLEEQLSQGSLGSHFKANFIKRSLVHRHRQNKMGPTGPGWTHLFHFSDWILNLSCVYRFFIVYCNNLLDKLLFVVYCVKRQTNLLWTCVPSLGYFHLGMTSGGLFQSCWWAGFHRALRF